MSERSRPPAWFDITAAAEWGSCPTTHSAAPSGTGATDEDDPTPARASEATRLGESVSGLPRGSGPSQRGSGVAPCAECGGRGVTAGPMACDMSGGSGDDAEATR